MKPDEMQGKNAIFAYNLTNCYFSHTSQILGKENKNYFLLDIFLQIAYTITTTDRENRRFASMGVESVFSLFVLG